MNKFMMMLLAMLCAGMLGFVACGDDDEDTDDKDSDVEKNSDEEKDSDKGEAADPFKDLNCEETDTMKCDYMICQFKVAFDAVDCSLIPGICDCYDEYVKCMTALCPAGEEINPDNAAAMGDCGTAVGTCTTEASN